MKLSEAQKEIIEKHIMKLIMQERIRLLNGLLIVQDILEKSLKITKQIEQKVMLTIIENIMNERKAIVLCRANSRTIKKLEEIGLVEILEVGGGFPDTLKILNY